MAAQKQSRDRKVKVLATLGPASGEPDMIEKMFRAGVDAFRMNMSHGQHKAHAENVKSIRALEKKVGRPIAILADLQGTEIADWYFCQGADHPENRVAKFVLDNQRKKGDAKRVQLPHKEILETLQTGPDFAAR